MSGVNRLNKGRYVPIYILRLPCSYHKSFKTQTMLFEWLQLPLAAFSEFSAVVESPNEPKYTFAYTVPIYPLSKVDIPSTFGDKGCMYQGQKEARVC